MEDVRITSSMRRFGIKQGSGHSVDESQTVTKSGTNLCIGKNNKT